MASSSKPTGVHYALVVSVLLTIVCGVGWLLAYKGANSIGELRASVADQTKKAQASDAAAKVALDQIDLMKKQLGSGFEDVGSDTGNPNTVLGDMFAHIQKFSNGNPQPTLLDTLVKQSEALRGMTAQRDKLQEQLATEMQTFQQHKDELNAQLNTEKTARETAHKEKTDADNTHSEELKKKEADVADLRQRVESTQRELDEFRASSETTIKQLNQRVQNLLAYNRKVSDELEQTTRTSFEIADGHIVWVDPNTRRVYIDVGESDGLRPRTTFSVYRRVNAGVGRGSPPNSTGPEDIKGAIEVTRILGSHEAEARIVDESRLDRPIGKGDPIYSPLWSSGRGEAFAVVGLLDMTGDGKSDRDIFHELITAAGATIDNEVDDKGNLLVNGEPPEDGRPHLTERTKFLVIGQIPELGGGKTHETAQLEIDSKINAFRREMGEQAQERGIRVVSLSDFLSFMGYKSQRRLFVPGEEAPYQMRNAQRKAAVTPGSRSSISTGTTSGAYSGDKKLGPKTSTGTTSKFRGIGK
jgi:hypothetical protein